MFEIPKFKLPDISLPEVSIPNISINLDSVYGYLQYGSMFIGFILCVVLGVLMIASIDTHNESKKIIQRRYPKKKAKVKFKIPAFDDL
jgi:hypothetical protein